ncbi:DUF6470 family protein [Peribacillus asahii]|uniref:DUF6470 family protein n=1 Tax=Peribacillus asahii TaxID=228899 RepID=UPI0038160446
MQLPQIRMQSVRAQIGIQTEEPVQQIHQPKAVQTIQQPKAIQSIDVTPGKLTIDQSAAWDEMDIKPIAKRTAEYAQEGKQNLLEGIARRARQGDELMSIEKGGNVVAAHAKQNSERAPKQFNIGWIPSPMSVKVHYEQVKVNIETQAQQPIIDVQVSKATHDYTPGKVNVYMMRGNSLEIDVVNI